MPRTLGVCSWSLQPESPSELVQRVRATALEAIQLHLDPLRSEWGEADTADALNSAGISILSGMMTTKGEDYATLETIKATGGVLPDHTWADNLAAARANADLAERLGLSLVTLHAGFIPHEHDDPARARVLERVRTLAGVFADRGVAIALETGQETAETLNEILDQLPDVAVNFDPANMILYGMGDPLAALETLGPRVAQLHIKDATPTRTPGTWGTEVPVGQGAVDWPRFVDIADRVCPDAAMVIEREAGEQRIDDVLAARETIRPLVGARA